MRFLVLTFFFIISCSTIGGDKTKRIYICGDHECANKNEVRDYFENNISIEVYTLRTKREKAENYDLVKLNMTKKEKEKFVSLKEKEKNIKNQIKKRKKIVKLNEKKENIFKVKKNDTSITKKPKKSSQMTLVRLCKNFSECDIDEVSKIIIEMGNKKDFPDITETQ